jgi:hypothetical protein
MIRPIGVIVPIFGGPAGGIALATIRLVGVIDPLPPRPGRRRPAMPRLHLWMATLSL